MNFIKRLFTWWHGQTMNTQFYTWRKGVRVGDDDEGNVYYETKDGKRRWVIFNGYVEASRFPPTGTAGCTTHLKSHQAQNR